MTTQKITRVGFLTLLVAAGCNAMDRGIQDRTPAIASLNDTPDYAASPKAITTTPAPSSDSASAFVGDRLDAMPGAADEAVQLASFEPQPVFETIHSLGADEDLQAMIDSARGTVLVDFHATWCGPCKKQSVVLEKVKDFAAAADAQIIKVDHDQRMDLVRKYKVRSLPTLLVIKDGEVQNKKVGLTGRKQIEAMLR